MLFRSAADDVLLAAAPAGQHTLQAVTVTATMTEQEARTAPASVTVVTEEELAQRNAANLLDAVRGTPGVTFQGRQVGGRKTLALRGMEGKHTLTLIDGRRISASDDVIGHSDYQYGWLPMAAVERVEIIRGPLSALYGSEALGGVINLITKKPKDRWMASIGLSGATGLDSDTAADALRTSVYAAGPLGEQFNLAINAEKSYQGSTVLPEDRAQSEIEGNRTRSLGLTASWQPLAGHEVEFGVQDGLEKRDSDDINRTPTYYHNRYELDRTQSTPAGVRIGAMAGAASCGPTAATSASATSATTAWPPRVRRTCATAWWTATPARAGAATKSPWAANGARKSWSMPG